MKKVATKVLHSYAKPKFGQKAKFCYMGTDSFAVSKRHCKVDIAKDVDTRFGTSNYELERLLSRRTI